jgi:hypothetical protein
VCVCVCVCVCVRERERERESARARERERERACERVCIPRSLPECLANTLSRHTVCVPPHPACAKAMLRSIYKIHPYICIHIYTNKSIYIIYIYIYIYIYISTHIHTHARARTHTHTHIYTHTHIHTCAYIGDAASGFLCSLGR